MHVLYCSSNSWLVAISKDVAYSRRCCVALLLPYSSLHSRENINESPLDATAASNTTGWSSNFPKRVVNTRMTSSTVPYRNRRKIGVVMASFSKNFADTSLEPDSEGIWSLACILHHITPRSHSPILLHFAAVRWMIS